MIIDATNLILGRLSSYAAKKAILGENVDIVNCEKAIVSGRKDFLIKRYEDRKNRGTHKGPFMPKQPNLFVRRAIRGMLPYKKEKGKAAFKRIKCHMGIPASIKDKKFHQLKNAEISRLPTLNFMRVSDICRKMGGKIE